MLIQFNSCVFNLKIHEFKWPRTYLLSSIYEIVCPRNKIILLTTVVHKHNAPNLSVVFSDEPGRPSGATGPDLPTAGYDVCPADRGRRQPGGPRGGHVQGDRRVGGPGRPRRQSQPPGYAQCTQIDVYIIFNN